MSVIRRADPAMRDLTSLAPRELAAITRQWIRACRAAEAESEALRQQHQGAVAALREIGALTDGPHPEPCGTDACLLCLIHDTAAAGGQ